jgi:hypothetical protein
MFATIAMLSALAAAGPTLAPGTYHYAGAVNGTPAGTSTLTVSIDGATTTIAEDASGSAGGMQFSGKASLVLGAELTPVSYAGNYQVAGQNPVVSAAFSPTSATVTGPMSAAAGQSFTLGQGTKHFVVIEPGLAAGMFALPAQLHAWGADAVTAISPVYGRSEALSVDAAQHPPRPANVPPQDVSRSFVASFPFTIWYDPATLVPDEIDVPAQHATVTRVAQ